MAAIALNAAANGVAVDAVAGDVVGAACRWDLILCGDVCYEAPMTGHILPWLRGWRARPRSGSPIPAAPICRNRLLEAFASYRIQTTLELEDRLCREVTLYRLRPGG